MDATTTPSMLSIISRLEQDFPDIHFVEGDVFRWSPESRTICYVKGADSALLLHEVAHAALSHNKYSYDIDLLKMERDAWETAAQLAIRYHLTLDPDLVEEMLDSYRNWLHERSICPNCQATGVQSGQCNYICLACNDTWRANEARSCALRRYKVANKK